MANESCCVNAVVSSTDPCCASTGSMWWDSKNYSLKIMDWHRRDITSWAVETVNWKTGKVEITAKEILWVSPTSTSVYTAWGWVTPSSVVTEGSDSLITSGGVYTYLEPVKTSIHNIQAQIWQIDTKAVLWTDVVKDVNWHSTDESIPTTKAVKTYLDELMTVTGVTPITVETAEGGKWYKISVKLSNKTPGVDWLWVCRLATESDYQNGDSSSALTSDVIKPIIDTIDNRLKEAEAKIVTLTADIQSLKQQNQQQAIINQNLQNQINDLINNK